MMKRMIIMLVLVGLVLIGVFGFEAFKGHMIKKYIASMGSPVQTVSATKALLQQWQPQQEAVGSLRADKGVDVSNEISGIVEEILFNSGSDVKAGDLLVKLRADDDIAKLHSLEATASFANITYKRDLKQLQAQAISQANVDNDISNLASLKAQVAEQKAIVDKKFIRAPFSGHLGIRNIDLGQYLNAGTAIVTLQDLDTIYIDFTLPQQLLSQIKSGQKITVKNDAYPGKLFTGRITAINPKIDPATRNIQVRAAINNSTHALLPGMYATAEINTGNLTNYVTLPQTAITYNPYGDTVFILKDKGKNDKGKPQLEAQQTFVTVGDTRGDQVAILKGIKEGDMVVTSGQLKLLNGSLVAIDNSITPSDAENPKPEDQ